MKTFRHSSNERNRSNVIRLRMKHGAAGYGIYMMLLERLASEPHLRSELDYDMLAYDFQADAALIRHVVEDFDLFDIDLDADTFSHSELNRQMIPKAARAQQEQPTHPIPPTPNGITAAEYDRAARRPRLAGAQAPQMSGDFSELVSLSRRRGEGATQPDV